MPANRLSPGASAASAASAGTASGKSAARDSDGSQIGGASGGFDRVGSGLDREAQVAREPGAPARRRRRMASAAPSATTRPPAAPAAARSGIAEE